MPEAGTEEKQAWTEDRVALLSKLWNDGLSASTIAGQLGHGVTRNAVIGKVHRLNLAGRGAPPRPKQVAAAPAKKQVREPSPPPRAPAPPPVMPMRGNTALKPAPRPEAHARPQLAPAPEPLRLIDSAKGGRITILQLTDKTCRWPIGDPGHDNFCFCGHKPRESSPYCDYHARIAYQPAQDRQRRRA